MTEEALPPRIVLFDGVCGLCNRLVDWIVRKDVARALRYAPLQGTTAAALRARHAEITDDLDTMIFVENGVVFTRAKAVLRVLRHLPAPWRWLAAFGALPAWLLNPFYGVVARRRYRMFGKRDVCRIPTAEERSLILS